MSLQLKILIAKTGQTKAIKFAPNMSVAEACKSIREKLADGGAVGGEDHGLFQPAVEGKRPARWLKPERTLQYYDLEGNDELEYKKKHRPIKVKLQDETIKTILVDDTLSVADIVKVVGEKLSMSNCDEFSLKVEGQDAWLTDTQSLHEQGVADDAMLLFRKKYFVTDGSISMDDPVALHLLYVESRDGIVSGNHPCTQDEALLFAALQAQVVLGTWQKDKKYEFKEYLPPTFRKDIKKLEPRVLTEYKKLVGMKDVNAKYRYVQLCRSLKTYGITFFEVKRRLKGKAKPVNLHLGITREKILFMDEETKEVTKEYPLTHLRRWAASPTTFTLDFGDHEDDYMVLITNDADAISSMLKGYIDILLKMRNDTTVPVDSETTPIAAEETVSPIRSVALQSITSSLVGGSTGYATAQSGMGSMSMSASRTPQMATVPQRALPTNVSSAQSYVSSMLSDLAQRGQALPRNTALTPAQWKKQLISNTDAVISSCAKLAGALPPNMFDRSLMDAKAAEIATNLAQLVSAARNAAAKKDGSEDALLMTAARNVAEAIAELLAASKELSEKPDDPKAHANFLAAQRKLQAVTGYIQSCCKGQLADDASQKLLMESSKGVLAACNDLFEVAQKVGANMNGAQKDEFLGLSSALKTNAEQLEAEMGALAPAVLNAGVRKHIETSTTGLNGSVQKLALQSKITDPNHPLSQAAKSVSDALAQLLSTMQIAESKDQFPQFADPAKEIFDEAAKLSSAQGQVDVINSSTKAVVAASSKLVNAAKQVADEADEDVRDRLLNCARAVAEATRKLVASASAAASNPSDNDAHMLLQDASQRLVDATQNLVGDAAAKAALHHLRSCSKIAAAATTSLIHTSKAASATCSDPASTENLKSAAKSAAQAIGDLVAVLERAWKNPSDPNLAEALLKESHDACPLAYKLVAASKSAVSKITDTNNKQLLKQAADDAAEALQRLVAANKNVMVSKGQKEVEEALETFGAEEANLDSALFDVDGGGLASVPGQTQEGALILLGNASKQVAQAAVSLGSVSKSNPDELGNAAKALADAIAQMNVSARVVAGTSRDKGFQRGIVLASKGLTREGRTSVTCARAVAANPSDSHLNGLLADSAKSLADAMATLLNAARGGQNSMKECDDAVAALTAAIQKIEMIPGQASEFQHYADDLENNIKAVQSAILSLVNAARNNPKGVGPAAKTTASCITPLISSANFASGAITNKKTQQMLLSSTKAVGEEIVNLIVASKLAASRDDPSLREDLTKASNSVSDALTKLLMCVNSATPGQQGLDDALRHLFEATQKLTNAGAIKVKSDQEDPAIQLEELKKASNRLGEATKGIVSASRTDPEKLGGLSKDAASAVENIVESAIKLAELVGKVSPFDEDASKVREAAKELADACESKDPSAKQKIIKSAKDVTMATQKLVENVKSVAAETNDQEVQKGLVNAAQSVASATSALVNAAKVAATGQPGAVTKLKEVQTTLHNNLDALLSSDSAKITSNKAQKLLEAVKDTANGATNMVYVSKNVLKNPTNVDSQTELTSAARSVGIAIKNLVESAKSMGEVDLDEFIEKVTKSITDLDEACISATVGLLENTAPPGKTTQHLEEDLVEVSRELATAIKNLVHAQRESPTALAKAARASAELIPRLAVVAMQTASTIADQDRQQEELSLAKSVADSSLGLLQACKQNDAKEIANQAKNSSQAIAKLLSSLKGGVIALRDCDEASKQILENAKQLDGLNEVDTGKSYAESQKELQNLSKELVAGIAKVVSSAKTTPHEVGTASKKVASIVPKFIQATQEAFHSITDDSARKGLIESVKSVVVASNKIVQNGKVVAADVKNTKNQQLLSAAYKEVTEAIAAFVAAVKAGATGQLKCEAAIEAMNRNINELDGAALYAATGQLQPEREDLDIEDIQNQLLETIKHSAEELKNMVNAIDRTQQDLGSSAQEVQEKFDKLTKDTKTVAALLNSLLHQQEILMGAKAVGVSFQFLISNGIRLQQDPDNSELRNSTMESSKRVGESLRDLGSLAQNASAAASSGIKEMESARKTVIQLSDEFDSIPPATSSGAKDILQSAKTLADSVATILAQCSSSDDPSKLVNASNDVAPSSKDLIQYTKGALHLTDAQNGKQLTESVRACLKATAGFLDSAKQQRKHGNPDTAKATSDAADEVVTMIGNLVEACRTLPGSEEALKLFQQTDELEQLAERELMNAAGVIEDAARVLLEAKRRQLENRKNKDSPLPEEEITEAILDAARAITTATGTLVNAATVAQKELVASGKVGAKQQNVYRRDPAWAKGLISAAQSVAGTVSDLVQAANNSAQGKTEEEALVATAKGVAAATARLVFASRAKADPFSPTQKKLSAAAKAVAAATQTLVSAAKSATQLQEEEENKVKWSAETSSETEARKREYEVQTNILRLQKELENERGRLGAIRKNEYKDANTNVDAENAQASANSTPTKPALPARPTTTPTASPARGPAPSPVAPSTASPAKKVAKPPTKPLKQSYSLEELQKKPSELDSTKLEQYLSDADFQKLFGTTREVFAKLPAWKQTSEKQKHGLY